MIQETPLPEGGGRTRKTVKIGKITKKRRKSAKNRLSTFGGTLNRNFDESEYIFPRDFVVFGFRGRFFLRKPDFLHPEGL